MDTIRIHGARQHNLVSVDVEIPKGKLVVVTGPSGCGKSSLAFHTLYAEGQRRYVESLSVYARQFLDQLEKPDVDFIEGLSPSIAIEQVGGRHHPRSTVATTTEIHDYLRVIWAALGVPHDPETGERLEKVSPDQMVTAICGYELGSKVVLLAPVAAEELVDPKRLLGDLQRQGFIRVRVNGVILELEEVLVGWPEGKVEMEVVVDRLVIRDGVESRVADSVETAMRMCGVEVRVLVQEPEQTEWREVSFDTAYRNARTGRVIGAMSPKCFSYHTQVGACSVCQGVGEERIGEGFVVCGECGGQRLKKDWLSVRLSGKDGRWLGIQDLCDLPIGNALEWLQGLESSDVKWQGCQRIIEDVRQRLVFLAEVGLDYLSMNRTTMSLSGGEMQRIRLASQLGAGLSGVIYVLDEPSIGLHAADTARLIGALQRMRDLGNTVVVVEHDEEVIRAADHVIDMGPGAGKLGGRVLATGHGLDLDSPTGEWLRQRSGFPNREVRRGGDLGAMRIRGAVEHNLKSVDVEIPYGKLVVIAGPSGSGKSTLAEHIIRRALAKRFYGSVDEVGKHAGIEGLENIGKFVVADQSPIGKSPRSNPATFTGIFDVIRNLYGKLPISKQRGYGAGRFSFNASGGRCERCQGNGRLKVEMHFLPDAWVECPSCQGRRFNRETLEVLYKGKSISDVLDLSVDDASEFFRVIPKISRVLEVLKELGLGYLMLGQAANTLSGGEAQRLKLAVELSRPEQEHTLYLFDEPTTGLHFGDVERLLGAFQRLCSAGHSVVVVEHHLDVIANADWLIELGPGGGELGGCLVAAGEPWQVMTAGVTATAKAMARRYAGNA